MSFGTLPVATKPAISATSSTYTGSGTMPMRVPASRLQVRAKDGAAGWASPYPGAVV